MKLKELISGIEFRLNGVDPSKEIIGICSDSRKAEANKLFVCIKGNERDGHNYARHAYEKGAVVVSERTLEDIPHIVTSDTRLADAVLNSNFYNSPQNGMKMVAVTGTNGKTSVACFLRNILHCAGVKTGMIGTLGIMADAVEFSLPVSETVDIPAAMTTPDPACLYESLSKMKKAGVETVVMEVSSHGIAQKKISPINFDVGVFTNLSPEHLDFHRSVEDYFKTKASLFKQCQTAVINTDDPHGKRLREMYPKSLAVSTEALDFTVTQYGNLKYRFNNLNITSPIAADFTLENTLLAVNAAIELGVEDKYIEQGIATLKSIPGRMEHIIERKKYGFDAYIDYAHTPYAMEHVIRSTCRMSINRKLTVVFGCGGDRDKLKRPEMGRIAAILADKVILTNDNPRRENPKQIIEDILSGITSKKHVQVIPERGLAIERAVAEAEPNEIILLLGKGHEEYEIDKNGKHPFSERDILRKCAERRAK